VPKHIWEGEDPSTFDHNPPVNVSPYKLMKADTDLEIWHREVSEGEWWGTEVFGYPEPEYFIFKHAATEVQLLELERQQAEYLDSPPLDAVLEVLPKNPYIRFYYEDPPYMDVMGHARSVGVNHLVYPFNIPEFRRALQYLSNQEENNYMGYGMDGMHIIEIPVPELAVHDEYYDLIQPLIDEYQISKYDPDKAEEIVTNLGWTRGADGVWRTDNGTRLGPYTMVIGLADVITYRQTMVWVEELSDFGIEVVPKLQDGAAYWDMQRLGSVPMYGTYRPTGNEDPYSLWAVHLGRNAVPNGEDAGPPYANYVRYNNPNFDELFDKITAVPYDMTDPYIRDLYYDITEIWFQDVPLIMIGDSRKPAPFNEYYWEGWPGGGNEYAGAFITHPHSWVVAFELESTGRLPPGMVWFLGQQMTETMRYGIIAGIGIAVVAVIGVVIYFLRRK
jgi:peptide/nickel transport system substrate-binding protein